MTRCRNIVCRLLEVDVSNRLGNLKNEAGDIRAHRWFAGDEIMSMVAT